ncbi:MAG: ABC transporter substrate-binding protein [Dehalococcoidia bacterium]|nr:ABC transporter substrate-binding protein [Dehalococcoidia bacterium]
MAVLTVGAMALASGTTSSSPGGTAISATTKPFGNLNIAAVWQSGSIDPAVNGTTVTFQALGAAVFDTLVDLDANGQVRPALAERWEISTDGKTHTFYIRKGVKFHDGSGLTGADVKFSMERILAPESTNADSTIWRGAIASIEMKDDYTVVLHLKDPLFELLKGISDYGGSQAVLPKAYIEKNGVDYFRKNPIGSGPWKITKLNYGSRVEYEAFENNWRAKPKYQNITLIHVKEEATKIAMLKTGELDIAQVAPDSVAGLKAAGLRVLGVDGGSQYTQVFFYDLNNPSKYPTGEVRVRHAMLIATDRQEMANTILGGYGEPTRLWFVPNRAFANDPSVIPVEPFNPDGAKKLLADAGYSNGFDNTMYDTATGGSGQGSLASTINTAIVGYWQKIGIKTKMIPMEFTAFSALYRPVMKPEVMGTSFGTISGGGQLGFEKLVTVYHGTKGTLKNMTIPRVDELIDKIPITTDPAQKKQMQLEAATLIRNNYTCLPILDIRSLLAIGSKVGDITISRGLLFFENNYDLITHSK